MSDEALPQVADASSNGHGPRQPPVPTPPLSWGCGEPQPMWGIPKQEPVHGTLTTAYVHISSQGIDRTLAYIVDQITRRLQTPQASGSLLPVVEGLSPQRLSEAANSAVAGLPAFHEAAPSADAIDERCRILSDLAAGSVSADTRAIKACVEKVLDDGMAQLRAAHRHQFDVNPVGSGGAVAECLQRIAEFTSPRPNPKPLRLLRNLLNKYAELPEFENQLTLEAYAAVRDYLVQEARQQQEEALRDAVNAAAWGTWQNHLGSAQTSLKQFESDSLRFRQRLDGLREVIQVHCQIRHEQEAELASSVAVMIPGPTEEEVLGAMRLEANCADMEELINLLLGDFGSQVREHALVERPHMPVDASLPRLILDLDAVALAELIDQIVERRRGTPHTIYQLLDKYGLESCIEQLWDKATRTCFYPGRDEQIFGLSPDEQTILRLPQASNPQDVAIRQRLIGEFEARFGECQIEDVGAGDYDLSLTRVYCGFVVGLEPGNRAALHRMCQAYAQGHHPFLLGFLSTSQAGEVPPEYLALYQFGTGDGNHDPQKTSQPSSQ